MYEDSRAEFCAKCGVRLQADARFCQKCGAPIAVAANAVQGSPAPSWGAPPPPMYYAPPMSQPQTVYVRNEKSAGLAAVLSFFIPGLGQIYNGQFGKAILFFVFSVISCILILAVIGFITTPILWIWNIVDAYKSAENMNRQGWS